MKNEFDAVVIGSGPNGLSAAIRLQQQGLSVLVIESKDTVGGGVRSAALTLPGFTHDICSAIHPLAQASPFFSSLPLEQHGLEYIYPTIAAAHPFENGNTAILHRSINDTANALGADGDAYLDLIGPLVSNWPLIARDLLGPLRWPKHPIQMGAFALDALKSAEKLSKKFKNREARGLWAGMAAHSMLPLTNWATSSFALVLLATGHLTGWPMPRGGSQAIARSLESLFLGLGGKIQTGLHVRSMKDIPSCRAVLFDLTPKQILSIAGELFSPLYTLQLNRFRYGIGVFKIDWALSAQIPFTSSQARQAGTIHLGNTIEEITMNEKLTSKGFHVDKPFVLLAQQSVFDPSRAPLGKHTAWAYCHVPSGSQKDMTLAIESQVERFAPGFKDLILAKHTMNTSEMEMYNPNYVGGDISGGASDLLQIFNRPAISVSPYRTSVKGVYICSSSTPPGGGVHGMCGFNAAQQVLKDIFNIKPQ